MFVCLTDYFNNLDSIPGSTLYSYNHHKKTYSREKSQEITKFLKTCEELLRDDFGYSLKAVQTFTVQLMDFIEGRNKRSLYRVKEKLESNLHLGCIPRPKT
jgi:glycosylphosphatidylinositol transamidase (GPIT) subunit GPI8